MSTFAVAHDIDRATHIKLIRKLAQPMNSLTPPLRSTGDDFPVVRQKQICSSSQLMRHQWFSLVQPSGEESTEPPLRQQMPVSWTKQMTPLLVLYDLSHSLRVSSAQSGSATTGMALCGSVYMVNNAWKSSSRTSSTMEILIRFALFVSGKYVAVQHFLRHHRFGSRRQQLDIGT